MAARKPAPPRPAHRPRKTVTKWKVDPEGRAQIKVRIPKDILARVDAYVDARHLRSREELVGELCAEALDAREQKEGAAPVGA